MNPSASRSPWPTDKALYVAYARKVGREIYTLMKQEFGEVEEPVPARSSPSRWKRCRRSTKPTAPPTS